ncbi:DUF5714 domain-containing protein [Pseudoflavonifractor sp. MSJ-37]|uniref:DUF5714 domain-containing protein n=1 Tax=Pseudoflavonifractor sp. MSJ-37 TaxID=2841531 RepID=UPI001C126723|nr:DUF5714 domain-containing protein [Pseudoflavonifractor sp. MSJ-37]MBU5434318.1 SAM-dependent methyltransferase [Pseudoflavonifractor sp. MSJ-37]
MSQIHQPNACLLCGAPLVYLREERPLTCALCGRTFSGSAHCENGHFVCDDCHGKESRAAIVSACLDEPSADPIRIAQRLMDLPPIHMHGPEHHTLVGAALLTAYHNAGGTVDLAPALAELERRSQKVPGGICGFWGCCGAAVSAGIFASIATGTTPLSADSFGLCDQLTGSCLQAIGRIGGPRCCKRDSFLAISTAVPFVSAHLGVDMELPDLIRCHWSRENGECIGRRCPFHP